jgi:hypothetical protein
MKVRPDRSDGMRKTVRKTFVWFKSHPPLKAGAQRGYTKGVNPSSRVVIFRWGNGRLVNGRNLVVTVIGLPAGGAAVRIDSQATWGPVETEG